MSNPQSANGADPEQRNIVGRVTAYFINSQVTILVIAALVIFGVAAAIFTPKEENPQVVVPSANVYLEYPGAPAEVVEKTVTNPIESKVRELTGIEEIYSVSRDSQSKITVQFYVGEDWEDSLFKLQNKLYNWQDILPEGSDYIVKPIIVDNVPIVTLTVTGEGYSDNELRRIGDRLLEDLRSIPNTGRLTITGGHPRAIRIDLDPDRLASYGLSPASIAQRLKQENVKLPAGDVTVGKNRIFLEGGQLYQSAQEISNTIVGRGEGNAPIYLRDVANVRDAFTERQTYSRIHFREDWDATEPYPSNNLHPEEGFREQPSITLGIAKKEGTNAVTVAKQIFQRVDELRSDLPPGVEVAVSRNDGREASQAVGELYTSLIQAIIIVITLLVIFLGWREASIVAFAIPLTLAGTLLVGWIAGQTINRITLFALILSLGILVDDAIAVTENLHRHFAERPNMSASEKIKEGIAAVNELGTPILLSTVTVILAFIPMGFVTGMMGPYMGPLPFNVPVAMLISTGLAMSVTPYLGVKLIKIKHKRSQAASNQNGGNGGHPPQNPGNDGNATGNQGESSQQTLAEASEAPNKVYRLYRRVMEPLLDSRTRRRFVIFLIVGMLLATFVLPLTRAVKFRMLPKADENTFLVQLDNPLGTDLERTNQVMKELEAVVEKDPDVVQFETYVGTAAPIDFNGMLRGNTDREGEHLGDIRVHLTHKSTRKAQSEDVVLRLRPKLREIADRYNAIVKLVEVPPGPPVRSTMLAEVYGPDYEKIRDLTKEVGEVFRETKGVVDVDDSVKNTIPQMRLVVDRQKLNQMGLSTSAVAQTISMAVNGSQVSILQVPGELTPVPIEVRFAESDRDNISDLTRIQIPTPNSDLIPLSELVKFEPATVDQPIFHKNQDQVAYVFGEMGATEEMPSAARSSVYAVIDQLIHFFRNPLPEGYYIKWEGEWDLTLDVFRDLGLAMLVAVMLIYLILVGQFRSFKVPLIILGSIPLAMIGILIGFSLNGVYFSATAMIGVIALAGIVVRNAIVLLEFVSDRLKEGSELKEAVIEAGAVRFRPILLTSVTTMLGTLSILSDPVWSGLAWTLLCGMLTSSALTLVIIPLMYFGDKQKLQFKEKAKLEAQESPSAVRS
jgi:multidrug efflux pump subunit AcrB